MFVFEQAGQSCRADNKEIFQMFAIDVISCVNTAMLHTFIFKCSQYCYALLIRRPKKPQLTDSLNYPRVYRDNYSLKLKLTFLPPLPFPPPPPFFKLLVGLAICLLSRKHAKKCNTLSGWGRRQSVSSKEKRTMLAVRF